MTSKQAAERDLRHQAHPPARARWLPAIGGLLAGSRREEELTAYLTALAEGQDPPALSGDGPLEQAARRLAETLSGRGEQDFDTAVEVSRRVADSVMATSGMRLNVTHTAEQAQSIAAAAEELSASVDTVSNHASEVAEETDRAREAAESAEEDGQEAARAMAAIRTKTEQNAERIEALTEVSREIGKALTRIQQIASRTNILALNASVEAARAGESGRGFGVVAQEVRQLASRTKDTSTDIGQRIEGLQAEIKQVVASQREMSEAVENGRTAIERSSEQIQETNSRTRTITGRIHDVAGQIHQQRTAVNEVAESIQAISERTDRSRREVESVLDALSAGHQAVQRQIERLSQLPIPCLSLHQSRNDHVLWKRRIASMLAGREQVASGELADHHQCRLGRWYDQVTDPQLREHPDYRALAEPHEGVHHHGKAAADAYNNGDIDTAAEALARLADDSERVLHHLQRLIEDQKGPR
ncbi:MAG: methyl-accepting chemotaxis protein [Halorhodospira sp.]